MTRLARAVFYLVAGFLFGFLFLAEFGLSTLLVVQIAMLTLAVIGTLGAVRGHRRLEPLPLFVIAALALPIAIDARIVGLPRCNSVAAGVACLAGTRDVLTPFVLELVTVTVAIMGVGALTVHLLRGHDLPLLH